LHAAISPRHKVEQRKNAQQLNNPEFAAAALRAIIQLEYHSPPVQGIPLRRHAYVRAQLRCACCARAAGGDCRRSVVGASVQTCRRAASTASVPPSLHVLVPATVVADHACSSLSAASFHRDSRKQRIPVKSACERCDDSKDVLDVCVQLRLPYVCV
jgi:hypothetical protein